MTAIDVSLDAHAPTAFEVLLAEPDGPPLRLERDHPYTELVEDSAFGLVLSERLCPLPDGSISAVVSRLESGALPDADEVGRAIARRILL